MIPTRMICNECGKEFLKKLGKTDYTVSLKNIFGHLSQEMKCPKCGGYDTEVAE